MNQTDTYHYTVKPDATGEDWQITQQTNSNGDTLNIQLNNGDQAVLIYTLASESQGEWKFTENGTLFTEAQDNFNYNLTSNVSADKNAVTVIIEAVSLDHTLSADDIKRLMTEPQAMSFTLEPLGEATIDFRLVVEKLGNDNAPLGPVKRYFSQDPKINISSTQPM
ncbi:hypothetical protein PSECIP111951_03334 [Pseudoalteromonas holothuriae]|uniref:Uncharacterized protein n=1 Tax=Pseudoalteromonas holothuriae TaxID=2963714 RepID=A0ABM9GLV9_9GAMM|nr:hypothetical protein [Pseudoalteromonas sp. CIP111951]CAH9065326.1 hypothetical protein PSECIP111951_03334 [Pseudoalteromonas sp. CIP111951]